MTADLFIDTVPYVAASEAKQLVEGGGREFPEFEQMASEARWREITGVFQVPGTLAVTMRSGSPTGPLVGLAVVCRDDDWNVGLCSSVVLNTVLPAYRHEVKRFQREVIRTAARHAEDIGARWVAWSHRDKRSTARLVKYTNTYRPLADVIREEG